jgi:hypothetical protein
MSAYEIVELCIEAGMLPKEMVVALRNRVMGLFQAVKNKPSVGESSKEMCRQKIKFYMHLSEGDLVRARAALDGLRLLYDDALYEIMFEERARCCAVIGGATLAIQHLSSKTDENAKEMGDRFMGELGRWERMLKCRVA